MPSWADYDVDKVSPEDAEYAGICVTCTGPMVCIGANDGADICFRCRRALPKDLVALLDEEAYINLYSSTRSFDEFQSSGREVK